MKYIILLYSTQRDNDAMAGKASADRRVWTEDEVAAMHDFMGKWNNELICPRTPR